MDLESMDFFRETATQHRSSCRKHSDVKGPSRPRASAPPQKVQGHPLLLQGCPKQERLRPPFCVPVLYFAFNAEKKDPARNLLSTPLWGQALSDHLRTGLHLVGSADVCYIYTWRSTFLEVFRYGRCECKQVELSEHCFGSKDDLVSLSWNGVTHPPQTPGLKKTLQLQNIWTNGHEIVALTKEGGPKPVTSSMTTKQIHSSPFLSQNFIIHWMASSPARWTVKGHWANRCKTESVPA